MGRGHDVGGTLTLGSASPSDDILTARKIGAPRPFPVAMGERFVRIRTAHATAGEEEAPYLLIPFVEEGQYAHVVTIRDLMGFWEEFEVCDLGALDTSDDVTT